MPNVTRQRSLRALTVRLATSTDLLDAAFRLVHDQYVARGYMAPAPSGRRVSLFNALPGTKVFVACRHRRLLGTVSLVQDSPHGLPMDEIFRAELDELRATGQRLGEVSALAAVGGGNGFALILRLVRMMAVYAADVARLDWLCIAVNPRHLGFYRKAFAFDPFGAQRRYPRVNGAPAVGLRLDLEAFRRQTLPLPPPVARVMFSPAARRAILASLGRDLPRSVMTPDQFARFFGDHTSSAARPGRAVVAATTPVWHAGVMVPLARSLHAAHGPARSNAPVH
jgi:hypothetical protein